MPGLGCTGRAGFGSTLKNESTNVIIDFTKGDSIDSTGIGELVGYLGKFTTQNRKLILVNPSERIQKLLKLAKLDTVFKIYNTEEEAIAAESGTASSSSRAQDEVTVHSATAHLQGSRISSRRSSPSPRCCCV